LIHLVVAEAVDEFVHEFFRGVITDPRLLVFCLDVVPDGGEEVGLSESDAAIDEEGVVIGGRVVGDRLGGAWANWLLAADKGLGRLYLGFRLETSSCLCFSGRVIVGTASAATSEVFSPCACQ
jgi:hypothetical protein